MEGIHAAYFVQNGLLNKYIGNVLGRMTTIDKLKSEVKELLENIDDKVVFIKKTDRINLKSREIVNKIDAHSPKTFIISSAHRVAMKICKEVKESVMNEISEYESETYEAKDKMIYFINRTD